MALTTDQLEVRRTFLGGTDMAAVAGLSTYARPVDVWLEKLGEAPPHTENPMMAMGTLQEPVVASLFTAATGIKLRRPAGPVRDRLRPWLGGHLDRYAGPDAVFEAKWGERSDRWGESCTLACLSGHQHQPRVPAGYAVQLEHYLGVTGRSRGYLAVLLGYADFRWYVLERDDEVVEQLRELGRRFWHENVVPQLAPEPDGSGTYSSYLRRRYAAAGELEIVASPEQQVLWAQYRAALEQQESVEQQVELAAQRLQRSMGSATKLLLPDGHITWRPYQERRVAWQTVAQLLAAELEEELRGEEDEPGEPYDRLLELSSANTTTTTKRPFRPHVESEKE